MPLGPLVIVAVAGAALALSLVLVRFVRQLALRRGVLDVPNDRSSHRAPTPRVGGVGILAAVLAPTLAGAFWLGRLDSGAVTVLLLATVVSLVGLADDLRGLPPLTRLLVHAASGAITVGAVGGLSPGALGLPGGPVASGVAAALTVLWVAGFINAFNFMDGVDGIAASQALVAAAAWAIIGWWLGQPVMVVLAVAITAASAGFLVYNWSPATIFMGDAGSAFLGFLLAVAPLLGGSSVPVLVVVLPVWPFVFDTAFTLLRRARRGEDLLRAHRSHLYQRLTQCGWTHRQTASLYAALAAAGALAAVPMAIGRLDSPLPGLIVVAGGALLLWRLVATHERRRAGSLRNSHA